MPLAPGDTVDRYEIVRLLGAGGMGQVFEARDSRLQRRVALKILRLDTPGAAAAAPSGDPSSDGARLLREARLAAALEHPNVVSVYDVGEIERPETLRGTMYLAMELVEGRSLRAYVRDERVEIETRVRWLADVARALGAAHARGLVHRDIKPENVMIRADGVVKVLDFGIAKRTGPVVDALGTGAAPTMTAEGTFVGTPAYMAPEQMRGEPLDGRADQFAWGVVAYELLSGERPWTAGIGGVQLVAEILSRDPPLLVTKDERIPTAVAAIVMRALAKDREQRFPSMEALLGALEGGRAAATPPAPFSAAAAPPTPGAEVATAPTERAVASDARGPSAPTVGQSPVALRPAVEAPAAATPRARRPALRLALFGVVLAAVAILGYATLRRGRSGTQATTSGAATPSATSAPRECTTNAQCIAAHGGAPWVCRAAAGRCAPLETADCKALAEPGDLSRDDTVWIGTMFPLAGDAGREYGRSNANAVELARRDFAQTMAAVVAQPGSGARPLAVVSCDDSGDPAGVARHLADDVGAPAVVGFSSSAEIIDLAESVFLPRGTMTVAALNTSPLIATLPHPTEGPRLVWRTTYNTLAAVPAIEAFVEHRLEPDLRRSAGAGVTSLRVALLREGAASFLSFSEALFRGLRFNGKSALENGGDFREFTCDDACAAGPGAGSALVQAIDDFAPHVVVVAGTPRLVDAALIPLEAGWRAREARPVYVEATVPPQAVLRWIGRDGSRRRRFFAVNSVSNTVLNARFVMRYNAAFPEAPITRTLSPNSSYDAFYLLAFATYTAGGEAVTGAALASAMARMVPPGTPVDVGPSGIYQAFNTLRSGGSIDVEGATGKLDFDLRSGEAPVDMSILCVDVDAHGDAVDTRESGLEYRAADGALAGSMRCP